MTSTDREMATVLVLLSALTHGAWNLAARAVKGDTAVLVLGLCTVAPTLLGAALLAQHRTAPQGDSLAQLRAGWFYVLITGVVHALYLLLLSHSYKIGEVGLVYPVARGSSVVFVALLSRLVLPDQERMSALGLVGIAIVVAGVGAMALTGEQLAACCCWRRGGAAEGEGGGEGEGGERGAAATPAAASAAAVGAAGDASGPGEVQLAVIGPRATAAEGVVGGSWGAPPAADDWAAAAAAAAAAVATAAAAAAATEVEVVGERQGTLRVIGFALAVGMCTAAYSIDDAVGVTVVDPLLYQLGNCTIMACCTLPYMLCSGARRRAMARALRARKRYVLGIGVGAPGTYLIVLYAFRMAGKAPFVVALRQASIVFAAVLGRLLLREVVTVPKVVSVLLITAGVAVVQHADG